MKLDTQPAYHDNMTTNDGVENELLQLASRITDCERCPRLREYTAEVARVRRKAFRDQEYWGRPVPGFGDPRARLLVVGLAPAAHGGNRTGRVFTGDPSGDFLYATLARYEFANQPTSVSLHDGLELRDAYVCAAGRCAPPQNKPTRTELDNCRSYLADEMRLLTTVKVIVALGAVAWNSVLKVWSQGGHKLPRPKPKFGHGVELRIAEELPILIGSYHPSQRNTQTGLLTRPMFHTIFSRARRLIR
jgi:uracil-DNA glycosylase family 4